MIIFRIFRDDRGQDLAEYGIALAVITVAVALTAAFIGSVVNQLWNSAQGNIDSVASGS